MQNFNIRVIEPPSRRVLRVNVNPALQTISVKDVAVSIGLDRAEALALAHALTRAVERLADFERQNDDE